MESCVKNEVTDLIPTEMVTIKQEKEDDYEAMVLIEHGNEVHNFTEDCKVTIQNDWQEIEQDPLSTNTEYSISADDMVIRENTVQEVLVKSEPVVEDNQSSDESGNGNNEEGGIFNSLPQDPKIEKFFKMWKILYSELHEQEQKNIYQENKGNIKNTMEKMRILNAERKLKSQESGQQNANKHHSLDHWIICVQCGERFIRKDFMLKHLQLHQEKATGSSGDDSQPGSQELGYNGDNGWGRTTLAERFRMKGSHERKIQPNTNIVMGENTVEEANQNNEIIGSDNNEDSGDNSLQQDAKTNKYLKMGKVLYSEVYVQRTSNLNSSVTRGDHVAVAAALSEGTDPNICMPYTFPKDLGGKHKRVPVLTVAADKGYVDVVSALLEANVNTELRGDFQWAPLTTAVLAGHTQVVEKLLIHGADVHTRGNKHGGLPIHRAACNGHLNIVKMLHAHGSPLDAVNNYGNSPLHLAARWGRKSIAEWLVEQSVAVDVVNDKGETPADHAYTRKQGIRKEITNWLRRLQNTAAGVSATAAAAPGASVIHAASGIAGAQSTSKLNSSVTRGDHVAVAAALSEGTDPNLCMPYTFPKNLGGKHERVPVLTVAADKGYVDVVSALLEANVNTELRGDFKWTPLATAVSAGHTQVVEKLLIHGADVHTRGNKHGGLPIHQAACNGHLYTVKMLHAHGSPLDAVNNYGNSPLHLAAEWGRKSIAEWLVEQSVAVDAVNDKGETPADHAYTRIHGIRKEIANWLRRLQNTAAGASATAAAAPGASVIHAASGIAGAQREIRLTDDVTEEIRGNVAKPIENVIKSYALGCDEAVGRRSDVSSDELGSPITKNEMKKFKLCIGGNRHETDYHGHSHKKEKLKVKHTIWSKKTKKHKDKKHEIVENLTENTKNKEKSHKIKKEKKKKVKLNSECYVTLFDVIKLCSKVKSNGKLSVPIKELSILENEKRKKMVQKLKEKKERKRLNKAAKVIANTVNDCPSDLKFELKEEKTDEGYKWTAQKENDDSDKYPVIQAKIHANRKKRKHTIKKRKEVKAPNSITTGMEQNQSNLAPEKLELVEISDDEEYWNFETQEERVKRKEFEMNHSLIYKEAIAEENSLNELNDSCFEIKHRKIIQDLILDDL